MTAICPTANGEEDWVGCRSHRPASGFSHPGNGQLLLRLRTPVVYGPHLGPAPLPGRESLRGQTGQGAGKEAMLERDARTASTLAILCGGVVAPEVPEHLLR